MRQLSGLVRARYGEFLGHDFDYRQIEAAGAEVQQRVDDSFVKQRSQGHDERLWRQGSGRDYVDAAPEMGQDHLGVDQRVDDAVDLGRTHGRHQPAQDAAEPDDADPLAPGQVVLGH